MLARLLQLAKREWRVSNTATQPAFSLMEALLSIALFSLLIGVLIGGSLYGQQAVLSAGNRERATSLAEEALEAVRNLRDADYINLAPGTYGLSIMDNHWVLESAPDHTGIFSRTIDITTVSDGVTKVDATVTWQWATTHVNTTTLTTYLTQWK